MDGTPELLAQAEPGLVVRNLATGEERRYEATPTAREQGIYTVTVVFPEAGRYSYAAYDGLSDRLYRFPLVAVTAPPAPAAPADGSAVPLVALLVGVAAAAAAAGAALFVRRRRLGLSH